MSLLLLFFLFMTIVYTPKDIHGNNMEPVMVLQSSHVDFDETPDAPRDWAFDYIGEIGELKTKRDDVDVNQYESEEDARDSAEYMLESIVRGLDDKDLIYYLDEIFNGRYSQYDSSGYLQKRFTKQEWRSGIENKIIENEKQYISTYNKREEEEDEAAQRQDYQESVYTF